MAPVRSKITTMRGRIDFISGSLQYYRIIVKLIM